MRKLLIIAAMALSAALAQNPNSAKFPTAVATDTDLGVASNSCKSTLNGAVDSSTLTITLVNASKCNTPFYLTLETTEVAKICSKSGNVLTVCAGGRGYHGVAASHANGSAANGYIDQDYLNQALAEIKAVENGLGANFANTALLNRNMLFTSDNAYDIGASGASRPRDLYLGRDAVVGGTVTAGQFIGPGTAQELRPETYVFTRTAGLGASASPSLGTAGTNKVITLTPCPAGITSDSAAHAYVRIDTAGTPETPLIKSFAPGSGNCTITVDTVNDHSAGWRVTNNGDGLQEALVAAMDVSGNKAVRLAGGYWGYYRAWKPIWVPGNVGLFGAGPGTSIIQAQANNTVILDAIDGHNTLEGFGLSILGNVQGVSGSIGIRLGSASVSNNFTTIRNVFFDWLYDDILSVNASQVKVSDCTFYDPSHTSITLANPLCPDCNGGQIVNNNFFSYVNISPADSFIKILSTSSILIANNTMIGINFAGPTSNVDYCINNISTLSGGWMALTGNKCEAARLGAFRVAGNWTQLSIAGNIVGNPGNIPNWVGIAVWGTGTQTRNGINSNIVQCGTGQTNDGILLGGTYQTTTVTGNEITGACNNGINAGGSPTDVYIGPNGIHSAGMTRPIYAVAGVTVDMSGPFTWGMLNDVWSMQLASNGSRVYCSDCNTTCSGSGSGRTCFKENGTWTH